MPNNNPTGKNQHTANDRNQGMKNAGTNERSGQHQRSAGSRPDEQQGSNKGRSDSDLNNDRRGNR